MPRGDWWPSAEVRFQDAIFMEPNSGCHLWTNNVDGGGYGKLRFNGREEKAHRFSWIKNYGPIANGLHVLHKCDTPACCNPDHLFLGTPKENCHDKIKKGRANYRGVNGVNNNSNKLTEEQVIKIRSLVGWDRKIGKMFGVSGRTISAIRKRETWKHIP